MNLKIACCNLGTYFFLRCQRRQPQSLGASTRVGLCTEHRVIGANQEYENDGTGGNRVLSLLSGLLSS